MNSTNRDRKAKVLHIYKFLYDGGTERYIHTLISRMNPDRFSFRICCLMARGSEADAFENDGFPVYNLNFRPGLSPAVLPGNLIQLIRLVMLIRRLSVDVIHTHDNQPAAYARIAAWLSGVPIVYVTLHCDYTGLSPVHHRINHYLARLTTRFFAVSAWARDISSTRDRIQKEKYNVIHNGVNFASPATQELVAHYRKHWSLDPATRVIGNVGSLVHLKGQDLLIEAFASITEDFPDVCLFIIGSEREHQPGIKQNLIELATRYGIEDRVVFTGSRSDVLDILNIFEVYAMPSRFEGFGLSLVEAICAGVPAIISDIPALTEVCGNGKYALSFHSEDAQDLADKLRYALDNQDEMKRLGKIASQYARQSFSIEKMVAEYERIYEEDLNAAGLGTSVGE
ncbi:MAG: glycosyltransferase [Gammaproteobacteria bacterium]|nr:glycosyltransferase [Gammaproteobacteria bacterium]